jgi:osmotically-inducible protein OsmY
MKIRPLAMLLMLSAASVSIAGCGYTEIIRLYFQEQQYQKDQELIAEIKGALLADPQLRQAPVRVEAYLGAVRLSGAVTSAGQKQQAETVAEQTDGVESVVNDLIVREPS